MQQNAQKAQSGDEKKATKYCNVIHPLLNDSCPKCQRLKNLWCSIVKLETPYGGQFLFINLVDITKLFCNTSSVT